MQKILFNIFFTLWCMEVFRMALNDRWIFSYKIKNMFTPISDETKGSYACVNFSYITIIPGKNLYLIKCQHVIAYFIVLCVLLFGFSRPRGLFYFSRFSF